MSCLPQAARQKSSNQTVLVICTSTLHTLSSHQPFVAKNLRGHEVCIGVGRGGGQGGPGPPNNLRGGANIPFGPPNNPPTFSFSFYVKQEKITKSQNVSSRRVK